MVAVLTAPGEVETLRDDVRVGDIFMDDAYGRPLREGHLDRLTRAWDRSRAGVLYLSMRSDGSFACLDGWHRCCACRAVEGDEAALPARVYFDLDLRAEAALFAAFNKDRAAVKPGELFRSRMAAGEPAALEIHKIVTELGLSLSYTGKPSANTIQAISSIESVYSKYGGKMLRDVLLTLRNCMGDGAGAIQSSVIKGLAQFVIRYAAEMDMARLYAVLSANSTPRLVGMANSIRSIMPGTQMEVGVGMAILQLYNTGLKSKHLPPWQTRAYTPEGIQRMRDTGKRTISAAHEANRKRNGAHRG